MLITVLKTIHPILGVGISFSIGFAAATFGAQVEVQALQKTNDDMQYDAAKTLQRIKAKTDTLTMIQRDDCVDLVKSIRRNKNDPDN